MVFSHAFFASALINAVHKKTDIKNTPLTDNMIYFVAIVGSIFPDLDIALLLFDPNIQHRQLISHSLLPYILLLLITMLISKIKRNTTYEVLAKAFFIGTSSHILLDLFAGGLVLLAPLSFTTFGFPIYFDAQSEIWGKTYLTSWYMVAEAVFFILYLATIYRNNNKVLMWSPIFFLIVSMVMFLLVL